MRWDTDSKEEGHRWKITNKDTTGMNSAKRKKSFLKLHNTCEYEQTMHQRPINDQEEINTK